MTQGKKKKKSDMLMRRRKMSVCGWMMRIEGVIVKFAGG